MYKLPLPSNISGNLLGSALEEAKKMQNTGTGSTPNLQNLFNNIKPPDQTQPNLPDFSKMSAPMVDWKAPQFYKNDQVGEPQTQKIMNPNNFAMVNMLAGKGEGNWLPTMQMRQFQEGQNQNYINNLSNATQMDQQQNQWQNEFNEGQRQFNQGQSNWQNEFDWRKYTDQNGIDQNWAQIGGYMPDGSNTLSRDQYNTSRDSTVFNDWLSGQNSFYNPGNSGSAAGATSAIDDFLITVSPQTQADKEKAALKKVGEAKTTAEREAAKAEWRRIKAGG
jgi:hypothetical protein